MRCNSVISLMRCLLTGPNGGIEILIIYVAVRQTIQNIDAIFTGDLSYDRLNINVTRIW
jgi:hypothetical protein